MSELPTLPEGSKELGQFLDEFWPTLPWHTRLRARIRRVVFGRPKATITDAILPRPPA